MSEETHFQPARSGDLLERIQSLELRLKRIEGQIESSVRGAVPVHQYRDNDSPAAEPEKELVVDKNLIESNIFEYGLAWFGSIVLLFGIIFLSNFAKNHMNSMLASLVGYGAAAGVFILARYLRNSFTHLAFMLTLSGYILLYYITLRLYFFSTPPVLPAKYLVVGLLLVIAGIQAWFSVRNKNELPAVTTMFLFITTALFTDEPVVSIPLIILTAALSVYLFNRCGWWRLMFFTLIMVYGAQMEWLLNNPLMGNPAGAFGTHPYNLAALFAYGLVYSLVPLIVNRSRFPEIIHPATVLINGIFFSVGILFVTASYYATTYVWIFTVIALLCLVYSIFLKFRTTRVFEPAFFAIYSFMAMSVAVYGYTKLPDAFWLLSLQSLIVVSWALWFRSRIIVVMNTLLFIGIILFSMAFYPPVDRINFAFVITAFVSARVINWKKERLTLKTEMIRNTYLIALFFTMLFALYHAVPGQYVTLSWTGASVVYFILSLVLKNIKYRWMAIANVLFTGFYLFFVDLSHLETGYRVLAFLFLALISIGASLYFTKKVRRKLHQEATPPSGQGLPQ